MGFGATYKGVVKRKTKTYGFIICDDTFREFKQDVFISSRNTPQEVYFDIEAGDQVTFTVSMENGQPKAENLVIVGKGEAPVHHCLFWAAGQCSREDCPYVHDPTHWNTKELKDSNKKRKLGKGKGKGDDAEEAVEPLHGKNEKPWPATPTYLPPMSKSVTLHGVAGWFVPAYQEAQQQQPAQQVVVQQVVVAPQPQQVVVGAQPAWNGDGSADPAAKRMRYDPSQMPYGYGQQANGQQAWV